LGPRAFVLLWFILGTPIAATSLALIIRDPRGQLDLGGQVAFAFLIVTAMLLGGVIVLREAGICLVMASPLMYTGGCLGAMATGRLLRLRRGRPLAGLLVALPLVGAAFEHHLHYPQRDVTVASDVLIDARPDVVWGTLTSVRDIRAGELGWTFTQDFLGVPKPLDANLVGAGAGAVRYVKWGKGVHFEERITNWHANKALAWQFRFFANSIPKSIEGNIDLNGSYLQVQDGAYRLEPVGARRTCLHLQTHFWIETPLNAYFASWGGIFVSDFHRNVLQVIKGRAERRERELRPPIGTMIAQQAER
jgi:hypothetical protein